MYIKRIYLKNIRCFEEFELEFKKRGESALFAADNGDGKTTLLRSIAMGLCDESSAAGLLRDTNGKVIRRGKTEGKIKITLDDCGQTYTITTQIVKTDADFEMLKQRNYPAKGFPWAKIFVSGYGANRRVEGDISYDSYLAANAVYTLFNYDYPIQNPELVLRRYARTKKEQREICRWLDEILMLKPGSIELSDVGIEVSDKYGNKVPLGAAADGYRATLACICDMLGWALLAKQKNRKSNISGVVLFDEIEQHLHPRWQLKIMDLLHKRFQKIQFIVGTHSPLVVSGCKECAVNILSRGKHKRADVYGWLAEDVYREVMNLAGSRPSIYKKEVLDKFEMLDRKRLAGEASREELLELKELKRRLGELPESDPVGLTIEIGNITRRLKKLKKERTK